MCLDGPARPFSNTNVKLWLLYLHPRANKWIFAWLWLPFEWSGRMFTLQQIQPTHFSASVRPTKPQYNWWVLFQWLPWLTKTPGLWDHSNEGKTDYKPLQPAYVWEARSAFCLAEGCRSSISSFPSLPFPCRGKNESLSQRLASVIPQYRPGFHSCRGRGAALWHHFPLPLLWTCSLPVKTGA